MSKKIKVGLVTAWAECGMGYVAKNWVYTMNKFSDQIDYQIYSRAVKTFTPFRWHNDHVVDGPEIMEIGHDHFWKWVDTFKPDVILFQDQNIYGPTGMKEETEKLRKMGIKTINYPDWIKNGDPEKYKGLYDVNLAHVKRNFNWLKEADVDNPVFIKWGVIVKNFPFMQRSVKDKIKFYINMGTGSKRKGYQYLPQALKKVDGGFWKKNIIKTHHDYSFIATSVEESAHRVDKDFLEYFQKNERCELIFKTADNEAGGLFSMGDVYVYPTRMEGIGLTITESLCSGMPVVTSDYPTMNEWFADGEAGRLIKTKRIKKTEMMPNQVVPDTSYLAKILIDYIENPEQIEEQSRKARSLVETDFNWDSRDEEILSLLKN